MGSLYPVQAEKQKKKKKMMKSRLGVNKEQILMLTDYEDCFIRAMSSVLGDLKKEMFTLSRSHDSCIHDFSTVSCGILLCVECTIPGRYLYHDKVNVPVLRSPTVQSLWRVFRDETQNCANCF